MPTALHVEQPPLGTLIYNTTTQQAEVLTRDGWVQYPLEGYFDSLRKDIRDYNEDNEEN